MPEDIDFKVPLKNVITELDKTIARLEEEEAYARENSAVGRAYKEHLRKAVENGTAKKVTN